MKIRVKKVYYKKSKIGRSPATYEAKQKGGLNTDVLITIRIDPILRRYPELRAGILGHEINEVKGWAKGKTGNHKRANKLEPKCTRKLGGVNGFWKEIQKRKNKINTKKRS